MSNSIGIETRSFHWSLAFISVSVTAINILVLRMFAKFRKNLLTNSAHNRILCSLCFADALVGIFGTTLGVLLLNNSPSEAYRLAGNVPLFSCMFASILSLALLTADRLLAIKKPFTYGTVGYLRTMKKLICAVWCVPLYLTLQQAILFLEVSSETELRVRSLAFVTFFCIGFVSLFVTNSMLYHAIRTYVERRKAVSNSINAKSSYDATENPTCIGNANDITMDAVTCGVAKKPPPKESKIAKTSVERELRQTSFLCIIIVIVFLVLWTPLAIYRLCYAAGRSPNLPWLRRFSLCLTVSNSLLNPIIYLSFRKKLRTYFKRLFRSSVGLETSVGVV